MATKKGVKIAELFTKAVATTRCFDHNLRKKVHEKICGVQTIDNKYLVLPILIQKHRKTKKVKVVCCGDGRMVTEFQVGPEHLNQRGTLHGGFIAHLVDAISTYALTTNENVETRGVSIDLSVSYFSAAKEGDNIEVEAITRKTGKKIAFLEVEVRNRDKNQILAIGRHTKYIGV